MDQADQRKTFTQFSDVTPLFDSTPSGDDEFQKLMSELFTEPGVEVEMMSIEGDYPQLVTMKRQVAQSDALGDALAFVETEPDPSTSTSPECPPVITESAAVQMTAQQEDSTKEECKNSWLENQEQQPSTTSTTAETSSERFHDVEVKVEYMKECLEHHSEMRYHLDNILVFCDKNGKPSNRRTNHFLAKDTKTMGTVWQIVKENRRSTYDTFARAMRVGREKHKDYFEYLDTGKGSKKRVYKLGYKGLADMKKMESMLPKIC
uniref:ETS domain-containing protein n=1 Tax=Macrostomum lignano TaxID=282301 RepID=A0A1I8JJE6_9PLAT